MLADRWVMTSRCGGLELYKYKFGQHGAAEHSEDNICRAECESGTIFGSLNHTLYRSQH